MTYTLKLEPEAYTDIQEAIKYYNNQQTGLGKRFYTAIKTSFESLKINPFYQIRYQNKRCFYTKLFPFLIHYTVDEKLKTIIILAVIHTSLNPNKNYLE